MVPRAKTVGGRADYATVDDHVGISSSGTGAELVVVLPNAMGGLMAALGDAIGNGHRPSNNTIVAGYILINDSIIGSTGAQLIVVLPNTMSGRMTALGDAIGNSHHRGRSNDRIILVVAGFILTNDSVIDSTCTQLVVVLPNTMSGLMTALGNAVGNSQHADRSRRSVTGYILTDFSSIDSTGADLFISLPNTMGGLVTALSDAVGSSSDDNKQRRQESKTRQTQHDDDTDG
jgi:hypothetical protein